MMNSGFNSSPGDSGGRAKRKRSTSANGSNHKRKKPSRNGKPVNSLFLSRSKSKSPAKRNPLTPGKNIVAGRKKKGSSKKEELEEDDDESAWTSANGAKFFPPGDDGDDDGGGWEHEAGGGDADEGGGDDGWEWESEQAPVPKSKTVEEDSWGEAEPEAEAESEKEEEEKEEKKSSDVDTEGNSINYGNVLSVGEAVCEEDEDMKRARLKIMRAFGRFNTAAAKKKKKTKAKALKNVKQSDIPFDHKFGDFGTSIPVNEQVLDDELLELPGSTKLKLSSDYPGHSDLTVKDLSSINEGRQLSDEIINLYFEMLQMHARRKNGKVMYLNSFFLSKLTAGKKNMPVASKKMPHDYKFANVKRWTKIERVKKATNDACSSIFDLDLIIFPIHLSHRTHWMIGAVDFKRKCVLVYNPFQDGSYAEECKFIVQAVEQWLKDEWADKGKEGTPPSFKLQPIFESAGCAELPQQMNDVECGVFIIAFAYAMHFIKVQPSKEWPRDSEIMGSGRSRILHEFLNISGLKRREVEKKPQTNGVVKSKEVTKKITSPKKVTSPKKKKILGKKVLGKKGSPKLKVSTCNDTISSS